MTHTGDQLALLKKTLPVLDPDLVVLAFFAGNDFLHARRNGKRIVANDAFFDIDSRREMQLFGRPILFRSRAWTRVTQEIERQAKVDRGDGGTFTPEAHELIAWSRLEFFHRHTRAGWRFQDNIAFVHEQIREIREYLQLRGIAFAIVILPDEIQVDDRLLARVVQRFGLNRSDFVMDLPQTIVQRIARDEGIQTLDLLWGFREAASRDADPHYKARDTHWNDKGNQLAARLILPWLEDRASQLPYER
jgi:Arc/MetJ family transcription regulator